MTSSYTQEHALEEAWALLEAPSCSAASAKQVLSRAESPRDADFHVVKQVRCIVAAAHLRSGREPDAEGLLRGAHRGVRSIWPKSWTTVYDRCRSTVPGFDALRARVLEQDKALPRYFRTGLESCEFADWFSDWRKLVVFDAHSLKLLRGREFVEELFPTLVGVDPPATLISSLPLAPAAFGQAVPDDDHPHFQDVTWVAAADPDTGEGVVVRQDESAWDAQFLRGSPLSHIRRSVREFREEAGEHEARVKWDVSTCTNELTLPKKPRRVAAASAGR